MTAIADPGAPGQKTDPTTDCPVGVGVGPDVRGADAGAGVGLGTGELWVPVVTRAPQAVTSTAADTTAARRLQPISKG